MIGADSAAAWRILEPGITLRLEVSLDPCRKKRRAADLRCGIVVDILRWRSQAQASAGTRSRGNGPCRDARSSLPPPCFRCSPGRRSPRRRIRRSIRSATVCPTRAIFFCSQGSGKRDPAASRCGLTRRAVSATETSGCRLSRPGLGLRPLTPSLLRRQRLCVRRRDHRRDGRSSGHTIRIFSTQIAEFQCVSGGIGRRRDHRALYGIDWRQRPVRPPHGSGDRDAGRRSDDCDRRGCREPSGHGGDRLRGRGAKDLVLFDVPRSADRRRRSGRQLPYSGLATGYAAEFNAAGAVRSRAPWKQP